MGTLLNSQPVPDAPDPCLVLCIGTSSEFE